MVFSYSVAAFLPFRVTRSECVTCSHSLCHEQDIVLFPLCCYCVDSHLLVGMRSGERLSPFLVQ